MMRLPAFSAEISFYKGSKQYHAARGSNDEAHGRLLPAYLWGLCDLCDADYQACRSSCVSRWCVFGCALEWRYCWQTCRWLK
jgi:hypothetical protein